MLSTFISYSRADSTFAMRLAKDLKSAGFDVWLDQIDIPTGARWDDEVEIALESCTTFMIVLSPESLQSQNVKDEVGYAIDSGKDILPLKIKSGDIPFRLRRFQYVDFSKQSYQESLKEIKSLLSASGQLLPAKEGEQALSESDSQPTVKKIKAVTLPTIPQATRPTIKTPEAARSPIRQKSISRGLIIGIAALALLAGAGIIRFLGAGASTTATPLNETPVDVIPPTEQPPVEATTDTSPVSASLDTGESERFLTTFSGNRDLGDWEKFIRGDGRKNKVNVSQSKDGLVFRLNDPDLHAYYIYKPQIYDDVVMRMKAENLGQNTNKVSLVCRRTGDEWYEFMILGGGLWQFYDFSAKYVPIVNGGTEAIKPGKSINEYEMLCIGDKISLRINGQDVTTYQIRKNAYTQGQVGFSIASGNVYPIDMKVIEFEASSQSAGGAPAGSTSSSPTGTGGGNTRVSPQDGMTMVYVPEGEFSMGSEQGEPNEKPVHTVFLDAFWIDRTEVTNQMFAAFLNSQGAQANRASDWLDVEDNDLHIHLINGIWQVDPAFEDHPAIEMRWQGASDYCEWRGEGTRLPTEAQWEKAARGTTENLYPWGNKIDCNLANYGTCTGGTVEVGSFRSNESPYGALDMTGNVMEWVADWYGENYYQNAPPENPAGPVSGQYRVLRGGSFDEHDEYQARPTFRFIEAPDESKDDAGFRCVLPE